MRRAYCNRRHNQTDCYLKKCGRNHNFVSTPNLNDFWDKSLQNESNKSYVKDSACPRYEGT
jgi:hypothetical protein